MSAKVEQLKGIIDTILKGESVVMYDFLTAASPGAGYSLFLDKEGGITMGECSKYARLISFNPLVQELFPNGLRMEVSSPGIHRLLRQPWHFQKVPGKNIKIALHAARDGRKNFEGILKEAGEDSLILQSDTGEEQSFTYKDIKSARLNEPIKIGDLP